MRSHSRQPWSTVRQPQISTPYIAHVTIKAATMNSQWNLPLDRLLPCPHLHFRQFVEKFRTRKNRISAAPATACAIRQLVLRMERSLVPGEAPLCDEIRGQAFAPLNPRD